MARGWESKDVENQIEDWASDHAHASPTVSPEELQRRDLELMHTRVLRELAETTHPRLLEQKQRALEHVERQLAALGPAPDTIAPGA